ncbi:MAG: endopeptidase La [Eubacteriaceae bacterium]|nr:endopeptidase La [Eubacteriaceae bacterium]
MLKLKKKKNKTKSLEELKSLLGAGEYILPLIAVKGAIFGCEIETSFDFGKSNSIKAIDFSPNTSDLIAIAMQKSSEGKATAEDLSKVCCMADVRDVTRLGGDVLRVNLHGMSRVRIEQIIYEEPFMLVKVSLEDESQGARDQQAQALSKICQERYFQLFQLTGSYDEEFANLLSSSPPQKVCDLIMASVPITPTEYYDIMQGSTVVERLEKTIAYLVNSANNAVIEMELENKLMLQFTTDQRSRYLREKRNLISKELRDDEDDEELDEYRGKLAALPIQEEHKTRLLKEVIRLETTPPGSQEAAVIQSYLDCVLDLPWAESSPGDFDISKAVDILDAEHYGLKKVKDRIIEYIAVMKQTNSLKSPILCLVGPPGVGKTSVAKSISNATNRKFVRLSLGGMHDEAEIRGHRKTYVGAMPGRIIASLRQVQSKSPVFLLDEIDKLSRDIKGDPASALLEALDPEQNSTFVDTYIEIPFNLSDVMFITTANTTSTIPAPLLDRLELIELNGYLPNEKLEIAKRHLIGKQMKENGITGDNIEFTDEVIYEIIEKYTRETGVRQLERSIASLCRKAAKSIVVDQVDTITITKENLSTYLGKQVHDYDIMKDESLVGVINGLAWTSIGGDTLTIETNHCPGSGKTELTGNLGNVMKESARMAISYLKANAESFGIAHVDFAKTDIHIHAPEGAVPKDGPSAGIALACSILSSLTSTPVWQQIAMTGELTLTGRVLAIGGLREKLLAANRAKVQKVFIPKQNEPDLAEIPGEIIEGMELVLVQNAREVIEEIFNGDSQCASKVG